MKTKRRVRLEIDTARCKGCHLCVAFCRRGCLSLSRETNAAGAHYACFRDRDCDGCTRCALICPDTAIRIIAEEPDEDR